MTLALKPITSWAFSPLTTFERCPAQYRFRYIDKVPETPSPHRDRGILLHKAQEDFITGKTDVLNPELKTLSAEIASTRERYRAGQVEVEQEWAFDKDWKPCDWRDWKNVRVRIKLDTFIHLSPELGLVTDLKTGRKYGNEIKHADQGLLYAGAAFLRHPEKKKILVEMHYPDQKEDDKLSQVEYSPQFAAKGIVSFEKRAKRLLEATFFPPKPNIFNCRFCSYGRLKGNGHCKASA